MLLQVLAATALIVGVLAAWVFVMFKLVVLVPPNRIAVLSGRLQVLPDGRKVGYRIVEGRQVRIPLLETVDFLPELPSVVRVLVPGVFLDGGEQASFVITASLHYAPRDGVHHAVERFIGRPVDDVLRVVDQVLEGAMREVAATHTREKINAAYTALNDLATDSFEKLGLEISNVTYRDARPSDRKFDERLLEAGLLDIATATELACDIAADAKPTLDDALLAAAGHPSVDKTASRITLRWSSAQVPGEQLLAGARALAAVRSDPRAYR